MESGYNQIASYEIEKLMKRELCNDLNTFLWSLLVIL